MKFTMGQMRPAPHKLFGSFRTHAALYDDFLGVAIILLQAIRHFLLGEHPYAHCWLIVALNDLRFLQPFLLLESWCNGDSPNERDDTFLERFRRPSNVTVNLA